MDEFLFLKGIGDLSLGVSTLAGRLDDPSTGLEALAGKIGRLGSDLSLTLDTERGRLEGWLGGITARLDSPQYSPAEIKAEVQALEVKLDKVWRCLRGLEIRYGELPGKVERAPVDVILAIDSSGSMKTNDPRRLRIATAKRFIGQLAPQRDQAGVVSWDNDIDFVRPLTGDLALVEQKIERVDASGATNLNVGLSAAIDEFVRGRPEVKQVVIFLTDGDGTYTFSGQPGSPAALAHQKGITIYAIGLGGAPSRRKLEEMATATGGRFYIAPTAEDLQQIYEEISKQLVVPGERVMKITCPMD